MPFELATAAGTPLTADTTSATADTTLATADNLLSGVGDRYRLPASLAPESWNVGGEARLRLVRGYGRDAWYALPDGIREPRVLNLVGILQTDHDDTAILTLLDELSDALATAVSLYHVDHDGTDLARLDLLGSLSVTTKPAGVDGTLLTVTVPLLPSEMGWRDVYSDELEVV